VRSLFLVAILSSACVVKQYGSTSALTPEQVALSPVDFSALESQLETLIGAETENVDRRDRLEAAWELLHGMKTQRPAAQHAVRQYLERLIAVEQRVQDGSTDAIAVVDEQRFTPMAAIASESIGGDVAVTATPVSTTNRPAMVSPNAGGDAVLKAARQRMATNDVAGALAQLGLCRDHPCWTTVSSLWGECRDRLVFQEREQAGELLLSARRTEDRAEREKRLIRAKEILVRLNEQYPNSRHKEGIVQSIQLVERDLSELNPGN
jgi:hypothetical protein